MNWPIELIIRGEIPALKNNRQGFQYRQPKGKQAWSYKEVVALINQAQISRPSKEVENFIHRIKESIERQLPEDFEVIKEPFEVFVMAEIGVYYKSDLPKSDLDNAWTTLQESMFTKQTQDAIKAGLEGPVLQDDRQVASFWPIRVKMVNSPELTYTKLWVFPAEHAYEMFKNCLLTLTEMCGKVAKTT